MPLRLETAHTMECEMNIVIMCSREQSTERIHKLASLLIVSMQNGKSSEKEAFNWRNYTITNKMFGLKREKII